MDTPVDPTSITNWPAAIVAVVLILAVLVVPSVLTYLGNVQTKKALAAAQAGRDAAKAGHEAAQAGQQAAETVKATLTTTNGGSHVKDQLNRIEQRQADTQKEQAAMRQDQAAMAVSLGQLQGEVTDLRESAKKHHPDDGPQL